MLTCRCTSEKKYVFIKHHYSRFTAPFTSRVNDMQVRNGHPLQLFTVRDIDCVCACA